MPMTHDDKFPDQTRDTSEVSGAERERSSVLPTDALLGGVAVTSTQENPTRLAIAEQYSQELSHRKLLAENIQGLEKAYAIDRDQFVSSFSASIGHVIRHQRNFTGNQMDDMLALLGREDENPQGMSPESIREHAATFLGDLRKQLRDEDLELTALGNDIDAFLMKIQSIMMQELSKVVSNFEHATALSPEGSEALFTATLATTKSLLVSAKDAIKDVQNGSTRRFEQVNEVLSAIEPVVARDRREFMGEATRMALLDAVSELRRVYEQEVSLVFGGIYNSVEALKSAREL